METDAIKKFIQKIPFFSVFNDHELNKLVGKERIFKDYKEGDIIFDGIELIAQALARADTPKKVKTQLK